MRIKALLLALLTPLAACAQINLSQPGKSVSLGSGIMLAAPDFDADAAAYFLRAGVTDATAKRQLSDFVKGVKALGLWANMVCWPMRASQNAGTGSTVYSLGGLGTFSGTLVNGPTWGDGITFVDSSGQYVSTGLIVPSTALTLFGSGVRTTSGSSGDDNFMGQLVGNATFALRYRLATTRPASQVVIGGNSTSTGASGTFFTNNSPQYWASTHDGTTLATYQGGSLTSSVSASGLKDAANAGLTIAASNTGAWNGVIHFAAIFYVAMDNTQLTALGSLYKSTLGQGLGLP